MRFESRFNASTDLISRRVAVLTGSTLTGISGMLDCDGDWSKLSDSLSESGNNGTGGGLGFGGLGKGGLTRGVTRNAGLLSMMPSP